MLCCVAAVAPHEPVGACAIAEVGHRGGDGVHHVVVPGASSEWQATGAGELAVKREPQRLGAQLNSRREAAIEIDDVDVVDSHAGELERQATAEFDGRSLGEAVTVRHEAVLVAIGARMDEHPTVARHAQRLRLFGAAHNERCAHVDIVVRVHVLRVREADHAIRGTWRTDFFGRARPVAPGVWIRCSDLAEASPEFAGDELLFFDGAARSSTNSCLKHRIYLNGHEDAVGAFCGMTHVEVFTHQRWELSVGGLGPIEINAIAAGPHAAS